MFLRMAFVHVTLESACQLEDPIAARRELVLLAPISAWLAGESRCSAAVLAQALRQVGRAALASLSSRSGAH
jgi:hypothetical protein